MVDDAPAGTVGAAVRCVVWLADDPRGWEGSLPSIVAMSGPLRPLHVATAARKAPPHLAVSTPVALDVRCLSTLLRSVDHGNSSWIVVAGAPCIVPANLLETLSASTDDRYATVSFMCNAAGPLSFPFGGTEVPWILGGKSPESTTDRLRSLGPPAEFAPAPFAAGPIVAISTSVLRLLPDGWDAECESWAEAVATFGLAAQERGLINVLDPSTFVHRPADLRPLEALDGAATGRLRSRFPWFERGIEMALTDPNSPLRLEHALARVKISGLNVLLDGSCLGPNEMGTQVGLIAICQGLAARSDVARVAVTLPGTVPRYARGIAEHEKISFVPILPDGNLQTHDQFDVMFRPFQPDVGYDPRSYRGVAGRIVGSILDLIAFQNGSYFPSDLAWVGYRNAITHALGLLDGLTTISLDVARMIEFERLPISRSRVFPVPYGTEHLSADAPVQMPDAFDAIPAAEFLVCLGTNYGHKNRDLAIRTLHELRRRGRDLSLVLVGPAVPYGSTRLAEVRAGADHLGGGVIHLGDATSAERNWLLAHATAVLYPTSAEGFGLVPYEAAWLGTPSVFVPFGPLSEIAGSLDVTATEWSAGAFADAVERLLDPQTAAKQVTQLRQSSDRYSWARTCSDLVEVFRTVLAMPAAS